MARRGSRFERRGSDYYDRRDDRGDNRSPRNMFPPYRGFDDYRGPQREPASRPNSDLFPHFDRDSRKHETDRDGDISMCPPPARGQSGRSPNKPMTDSPIAKHMGNHSRADSKTSPAPAPKSQGGETQLSQNLGITSLVNLISERVYWYTHLEAADKKHKKVQHDKERMGDKRLEFASINDTWQQQLNATEHERTKCKQKVEQADRKLHEALVPFINEHQNSGQAGLPGTPQAQDHGSETTPYLIREEAGVAELAKLRTSLQKKADGEDVEVLKRDLDEEKRKNRTLEERLGRLEQKLQESERNANLRIVKIEARTSLSSSLASEALKAVDNLKAVTEEKLVGLEPRTSQPSVPESLPNQSQMNIDERNKLQETAVDHGNKIKDLSEKLEPILATVEKITTAVEEQGRKLEPIPTITEQLQSNVIELGQKALDMSASFSSALANIEALTADSEKMEARQGSFSEENKRIINQIEKIQHQMEEYSSSVQARGQSNSVIQDLSMEEIRDAAAELPKLKEKMDTIVTGQLSQLARWEERFNAAFKERFMQLADGIGKLIEDERVAREATTEDVRLLNERAFSICKEVEECRAKIKALEADGSKAFGERVSSLGLETSAIKTQIETLGARVNQQTNNNAIESLAPKIKALETQVQGCASSEQDMQMQVAHISDWANKFSSKPFYEQVVAQLHAVVPTVVSLNYQHLEKRVDALERRSKEAVGVSKKRKAPNDDNDELLVIDSNY